MTDNQEPTFSSNWTWDEGDGDAACDLAAAYYERPMPWQRDALRVMLARRDRTKAEMAQLARKLTSDELSHVGRQCLLHPVIGLSVPRQNGKSWVVRARCFYGLTVLGERILYTCQNQSTADEMFEKFRAPFEDRNNTQLFANSRVRYAHGEGGIWYDDEKRGIHGYVSFSTRTAVKSRGTSNCVLINDESQDLTRAQQKSAAPTLNAAPNNDPQTIYIGTPNDADSRGDVFLGMHKRVHAGTSSMAWAEWGVTEIGDTSDRTRWARVNPGWDYIVVHSSVEADFDSFDPLDFAVEMLGLWAYVVQGTSESIIDAETWDDTSIATMNGERATRRTFGVKFAPDGSYVLSGCIRRKDGTYAFEVVEEGSSDRGTRGLASSLMELSGKASCVSIDGQPGGQLLVDNMAGSPRGYVVPAKTSDMIAACAGLLESLDQGTAFHTTGDRQAALDEAARTVTRRKIGNAGGWGFDGNGSTVIESCALALWAAKNSKRNPRRKQRML